MKGWKTWLTAISSLGVGVFYVASGNIEQSIPYFITFGGIIGIGHKVEKSNKINY